jgi:excisionase family DNA binding protein
VRQVRTGRLDGGAGMTISEQARSEARQLRQHRDGGVRAVSRHRQSDRPDSAVHDEILTTDEVTALLKIPKATLYRWVSQGTAPPFYKIGRANRWKRSEVMAWFDAHLDEVSRDVST